MKPSRSRSSDAPSRCTGSSQQTALANRVLAHRERDMARDASNLIVERPRDGLGDDDASDVTIAPREGWSWTNWLGPVIVSVLGVVAVGVVVSAITVVSREPFGPTGAVIPTRPITTTTVSPPPPSSGAPIPPPATRAPSAAPPAIVPTTVPTSAPPPPPPKPSTTHPPSTRSEPSSAHPTTHQPFPQETTDFLGPPGTNN
jgi:hypothetical protein